MGSLADFSLDVVEVNLEGRQNGLVAGRAVALFRSLCLLSLSQASLLLSSHSLIASFSDKCKLLLLLVEDEVERLKFILQLDRGVLYLVDNHDRSNISVGLVDGDFLANREHDENVSAVGLEELYGYLALASDERDFKDDVSS